MTHVSAASEWVLHFSLLCEWHPKGWRPNKWFMNRGFGAPASGPAQSQHHAGRFAPDRRSALRFMESPLPLLRMHRNHEPEIRKPLEIKTDVFRFMESVHGI